MTEKLAIRIWRDECLPAFKLFLGNRNEDEARLKRFKPPTRSTREEIG
jgi:hypothetical protein